MGLRLMKVLGLEWLEHEAPISVAAMKPQFQRHHLKSLEFPLRGATRGGVGLADLRGS